MVHLEIPAHLQHTELCICYVEQQQNKLENKGSADHIPTMSEDEVSVKYLQICRRGEKQQIGKINPPLEQKKNLLKKKNSIFS